MPILFHLISGMTIHIHTSGNVTSGMHRVTVLLQEKCRLWRGTVCLQEKFGFFSRGFRSLSFVNVDLKSALLLASITHWRDQLIVMPLGKTEPNPSITACPVALSLSLSGLAIAENPPIVNARWNVHFPFLHLLSFFFFLLLQCATLRHRFCRMVALFHSFIMLVNGHRLKSLAKLHRYCLKNSPNILRHEHI